MSNATGDNEGGIPPYFYDSQQYQERVNPDPPRGSITEGKDIMPAFSALIREGKAAQYIMLENAIRTQRHFPTDNGILSGLRDERMGSLGQPTLPAFPLNLFGGSAPENFIGQTLNRVCRKLEWVAIIPRLCTDEEIAAQWGWYVLDFDGSAQTLVKFTRDCCEIFDIEQTDKDLQEERAYCFDLPEMTDNDLLEHFRNNPLPEWYQRGIITDQHQATGPKDDRFPAITITSMFRSIKIADTEENYTRWTNEFAAEVELGIERFKKQDELPRELTRLIDALRTFEVGTAEGAELIAELLTKSIGQNILGTLNEGKARLLRRLEEIAEEHLGPVATNGSTATQGTRERMEWNGSTIEFVTIFKNLLKSNYVELPSSGGKQGEGNVTEYIRRLQQTFIIRKEDETEFTPEGLADRWRGKPMGEEREKQFDIPEATRKRPRT